MSPAGLSAATSSAPPTSAPSGAADATAAGVLGQAAGGAGQGDFAATLTATLTDAATGAQPAAGPAQAGASGVASGSSAIIVTPTIQAAALADADAAQTLAPTFTIGAAAQPALAAAATTTKTVQISDIAPAVDPTAQGQVLTVAAAAGAPAATPARSVSQGKDSKAAKADAQDPAPAAATSDPVVAVTLVSPIVPMAAVLTAAAAPIDDGVAPADTITGSVAPDPTAPQKLASAGSPIVSPTFAGIKVEPTAASSANVIPSTPDEAAPAAVDPQTVAPAEATPVLASSPSPAAQEAAVQMAAAQISVQGRVVPDAPARPATGKDRSASANPLTVPAAGAAQSASEVISPLTLTAVAAVEASPGQDQAPSDAKLAAVDQPAGDSGQPQTHTDPAAQGALVVAAPNALMEAQTPVPVATPQTVSQLAAYMASQANGAKATRFQVALDPAGLGKVDVQMQISARGELTAALNFANPHAAQELGAHAAELQSALQQAGFDVSSSALTFTTGDPSGQGLGSQQQQQQRQADTPAWRQGAFASLADASETQTAPPNRSARSGGVDVTI